MSFNEKSDKSKDSSEDENEAENGQEDIEAMKAKIKARQRKLSAAQNRARKSKTKPVNFSEILVKWQALGMAEILTSVVPVLSYKNLVEWN